MKITAALAALCNARRLAAALALPLLLASAPHAVAQGSLTPPAGAPAPTMKTLTQLEPRTPLQAGAPGVTVNPNRGFTITAPGSYYLMGNLTVATGDGIVIEADDVSLDLSGFVIRSSAPAATVIGHGISVLSARSVVIRNGRITGQGTINTATTPDTYTACGFDYAIRATVAPTDLITVEHVQTSACRRGITLSTTHATLVRDCAASRHSLSGIYAAVVTSSIADAIGGTAINARAVSSCTGASQTGTGISGVAVTDCIGSSVSSYGIFGEGTVSASYGSSSSGFGLLAITAINSYGATGSGSDGLYAFNATNCYGLNGNNDGLYGLRVTGTAAFCRGANPGGTALSAPIAIGCTANGGTITATHKYLMP